jgi:hypothetical protein
VTTTTRVFGHVFVILPFVAAMHAVGPQLPNERPQIDAELVANLDAVTDEFLLQAQRMPPLSRKLLLFDEIESTDIAPHELLAELSLPDEIEEEARRGLSSSESILQRKAALSTEACAALRAAVDAEWQEKVDSVDGAPDHQLNLSGEAFERVIGRAAVLDLLQMAADFGRQQDAGAPPAAGPGSSPHLGLEDAKVFVRRYGRSSRPWNPFHTDSSALTVNVALNDRSSFTGGKLLCAFGEAIRPVERDEGDATVHASTLLHGVSMLRSGVRYSLIIFLGQRRLLPKRLRFDEERRRAEAAAMAELTERLSQAHSPFRRRCAAALLGSEDDEQRIIGLLTGSQLANAVSHEAAGRMIEAVVQTYDAPHLMPSSILHRMMSMGNPVEGGRAPPEESDAGWCFSLRALLTYADSCDAGRVNAIFPE